MKWILPFLLAFCSLSCANRCEDDVVGSSQTFFMGEAQAKLNDADWPGYTKYLLPGNAGFNLQLEGQMPDSSEQYLNIHGIQAAVGRYAISDLPQASGARAVFGLNGDVVYDSYRLLEDGTANNFIEIANIDAVSGMVEGSFEVAFVIDSLWLAEVGQSRLGNPDTLRFTNGAFKVKLGK